MTRVLFLGGLGRSGTTLVERMLGELPGVVALGEVVHLWRRDLRGRERCGCGTRFAECGFWRAVGETGFGGWDRVDVDRVLWLQGRVERTRHIPLLAAGRRAAWREEYAGHYRRLYAAAAAVAGAEVVVDSSKHSALAWCLAGSGVDIRVLHVVRDARGVAYSWTKQVTRPEAGGDRMTRYSPVRSALLWSLHNLALSTLPARGVPVARLHYERFLADPVAGVRAVAGFAGRAVTGADLAFVAPEAVRLGRGHSAAGNPMRFTAGTVPLRRDDAWRSALPARHRRLVSALCAPLLLAYGYPLWSRR